MFHVPIESFQLHADNPMTISEQKYHSTLIVISRPGALTLAVQAMALSSKVFVMLASYSFASADLVNTYHCLVWRLCQRNQH